MGVTAESTGGRTDVLTAAPTMGVPPPIITVLPRTITALALTTTVPPTMLPATSGAGTGGELAEVSLKALGVPGAFFYSRDSRNEFYGICRGPVILPASRPRT